MTNTRLKQRVATRERILSTARYLFREASFEQVGVREIATEAGVATGTVIAAFGSKGDLLNAIVIEDLELQLPLMETSVVPFEATFERLQALCLACLKYQSKQLPIFRATMADAWTRTLSAENRICAAVEPIISFIISELDRGISRGDIRRSTNTRLAAQLIFEVVVNSFRIALYSDRPVSDLSAALAARLAMLLGAFSKPSDADTAPQIYLQRNTATA